MDDPHRRNQANSPDESSSSAGNDSTLLCDTDRSFLLTIARQTLEQYLSSRHRPSYTVDSPALQQQRAVFVTLWRRDTGELRGCRGESMARRPLTEAVSAMAIASATDDPRFSHVTLDELPKVRIDINALTPLEPIDPMDVEIGVHGLMIGSGRRAGLLLPDVPVRLGWNRGQFLEGVCEKAMLPRDAWRDEDATLLGFQSEEWGEE